jgi:hypothetical protein
MATFVEKLKEKDRTSLIGMFGSIFLDGECYAFAIALHQGLGCPLIGLMEGDVIRHAGVRCPNGGIRDVRGELTEDNFGDHFLSAPHLIRDISIDELYLTRPIDEISIMRARRLAEAAWPDLPWIQSLAKNMKAFTDELEKLSRKHGIWIRSCVPASPPHLSYGDDAESGYELLPALDGGGFTINRSYR